MNTTTRPFDTRNQDDLLKRLKKRDAWVNEAQVDIPFEVNRTFRDEEGNEEPMSWPGSVISLRDWGSHYTVTINARGLSFNIATGPSEYGWFVSVLNFGVARDAAGPADEFYTWEKLCIEGMNKYDAAYIATGVYKLPQEGMLPDKNPNAI